MSEISLESLTTLGLFIGIIVSIRFSSQVLPKAERKLSSLESFQAHLKQGPTVNLF